MARAKKNRVSLTDNDVKYLKNFMKKKSTNQTLYTRCHLLIKLDENHSPAMTYDQCIEACSVSRGTIAKIVRLFGSGGY